MEIGIDLLKELKKKYTAIYSAQLGKNEYIFRPITIREYKDLQNLHLSSAEIEDYLVELCVVFPDGAMEMLRAGEVTSLAEEILEISGFFNVEMAIAKLTNRREELETDIRTMMKAFVITAMPIYTEEQLEDLTFDEIIDKVILSEQIFKLHQALGDPQAELKLILKDPVKEQEEEASKDPIEQKLKEALGNM